MNSSNDTGRVLQASQESSKCFPVHGSPLVLGAGGWNIFHHFGVLKAMRELGIDVGEVTGVSAGSMTAAFLTNGFTPEQMIPIFLAGRGQRTNPAAVLPLLRFADPLSMAVGGMVSIRPHVEKLVAEYGLKPTRRLKIVACDYFTKQPVVFEGEDMDLVTALTASCSPPGVFQPVWYMHEGRPCLLVDGAVYHYNPTEFSSGPAIVSRFRPASQPPSEWQLPIDLYFHFREMFFPVAGNNRYVDEKRNLVIETGLPDVAGLNFGISEATCLRMVENGYNTAHEVLTAALASGRFCKMDSE